MKMTVNGQSVLLPPSIETVRDLLEHFSLNKDLAIVEVNESILAKTTRDDTRLSEGDRVEIVQFVGGG